MGVGVAGHGGAGRPAEELVDGHTGLFALDVGDLCYCDPLSSRLSRCPFARALPRPTRRGRPPVLRHAEPTLRLVAKRRLEALAVLAESARGAAVAFDTGEAG